MAIAVDASSPAVAASSTASADTAAFTPPSASVLVAFGQGDANNSSADETLSVTDSASGSWQQAVLGNANGGAVAVIFWRLCPTSPGSMTVSMTDNKGSVAKRLLVRVFTGTDQANPIGATVLGTAAVISYVSTVANSWGWSCGLASNATLTAGGTCTLQDTATGFDSGDAVFTLSQTATTATPGTTVTMTESGGTVVHHVAVELLPPGSGSPALPPAMRRRRTAAPRPAPARARPPVITRTDAVPAAPARRQRPIAVRRGRAVSPPWVGAAAPVNPAWVPPARRPRTAPPARRAGRTVLPPSSAGQPPTAPRKVARVASSRRGRSWSPPLVGAAAPVNPAWVPTPRRPRPPAVPARRAHLYSPPWVGAVIVAPDLPLTMPRHAVRIVPARPRRAASPPPAPTTAPASRRPRPAVPSARRGRVPTPVPAPTTAPPVRRPRPVAAPARRGRTPAPVPAAAVTPPARPPAHIRMRFRLAVPARRPRGATLRLVGATPVVVVGAGRLATAVRAAGSSSGTVTAVLVSATTAARMVSSA